MLMKHLSFTFFSGLCCDYGLGYINVKNAGGEVMWEENGGYGEYHSVMLHVAEDGKITASDDQDTYVSPSAIVTEQNLRLASREPSEYDSLWPGTYPDTMGKMTVNVKLDYFPEVRTRRPS